MSNPLDPDMCAKKMAQLLQAQAAVCREILAKSQQQQQLVQDRREDELLALLSDKQQLIDKHQQLAAQTSPIHEQWEAGVRERVRPEVHAVVEEAWNELREVLDQIIRLEDASRAILEQHKGKVSVDIGNLQRGKILNKAYGNSKTFRPPEPPRYSDKRG